MVSGKGGVGKSNVSLALASALGQLEKRVLLFDADLGLANLHILLGISPRKNLSHVVAGECTLSEILCDGPQGVAIIPGASGIAAMADLESERMAALVEQLSELENRYDYLIIDGGAGVGQTAMSLAASAETVLLVLTPEPTSLADVYATAKVLSSRQVTDLRVVVNMARSDRDGEEIHGKLNRISRSFLQRAFPLAAVLPYDRDVSRAVRAQKSILQAKPSARFSARMRSYARAFCGIRGARPGGFFSRLTVALSAKERNNAVLD